MGGTNQHARLVLFVLLATGGHRRRRTAHDKPSQTILAPTAHHTQLRRITSVLPCIMCQRLLRADPQTATSQRRTKSDHIDAVDFSGSFIGRGRYASRSDGPPRTYAGLGV